MVLEAAAPGDSGPEDDGDDDVDEAAAAAVVVVRLAVCDGACCGRLVGVCCLKAAMKDERK